MIEVEEFKREMAYSPAHNLHGYIRSICMCYAQELRQENKELKIRNDVVFNAAISEMARLGYVVLVKGKEDVHPWMPARLAHTIKRVKKFPIWVPSSKCSSFIRVASSPTY